MSRSQDTYHNIQVGYYDKIYQKKHGIRYMWHHLKFLGVLKELKKHNFDKLVDLACGPGTLVSLLPDDYESIGIDIAQSQVDYGNQHYGTDKKSFIVADVTKLPFENNSVGAFTSIEFFEHIPMKMGYNVLADVYRCLKPGGIFIITTPNYRSTWPILERMISKTTGMDYREQHISHFNTRKLKKMVKNSGFDVPMARSYLFFSAFYAFFSRRLAMGLFKFEFKVFRHGNIVMVVAKKPDLNSKKNSVR